MTLTKEDAKQWFINKYNLCYFVKHDDYDITDKYYMFYNEKYIRRKKISSLIDNEVITPIIKDSVCLFEVDFKHKYFYYDYYDIYVYLKSNYSPNLQDIRVLITEVLSDDINLKTLTSHGYDFGSGLSLSDDTKLSILTSGTYDLMINKGLIDYTKLKEIKSL